MAKQSGSGGFPLLKGVAMAKNLALEIAERLSAGAGLGTIFADTFKDNSKIDAVNSSGYAYQGTPNFNVIRNLSSVNKALGTTYGAHFDGGIGNVSRCFDGVKTGAYPGEVSYIGTKNIKVGKDWGAGNSKVIQTIKVSSSATYGYNASSGGGQNTTITAWGSNDGTNWTDLGGAINFTSATDETALRTITPTSTTPYRYHAISMTDGGADCSMFGEIEMYEAALTTALIVSVRALDLAATTSQIMAFVDTTSGNPDKVEASTDDGATWTDITADVLAKRLSNVPAGQQIKLRVTISGSVSLDFWGVAA